jgi:hypothetical protein
MEELDIVQMEKYRVAIVLELLRVAAGRRYGCVSNIPPKRTSHWPVRLNHLMGCNRLLFPVHLYLNILTDR